MLVVAKLAGVAQVVVGKKGEIVWDKLGIWILALVFLILLILLVFKQQDNIGNLIKEIGDVLRFG